MEKQIAQEAFDGLVKAIRAKRAFLIVDSKSHGYTCYFQVCSLRENGGSFTYMGLMNFLGFKQWKNRMGTQEGTSHIAPDVSGSMCGIISAQKQAIKDLKSPTILTSLFSTYRASKIKPQIINLVWGFIVSLKRLKI